MYIKASLNDTIKVKLTKYGACILCHQIEQFNVGGRLKSESSMPDTDGNGFTNILFGEFMEIFGPYISRGIEHVCEADSIMIPCERSDFNNKS